MSSPNESTVSLDTVEEGKVAQAFQVKAVKHDSDKKSSDSKPSKSFSLEYQFEYD